MQPIGNVPVIPNRDDRWEIRDQDLPSPIKPRDYFPEGCDPIEQAQKLTQDAYSMAKRAHILLKKCRVVKGKAKYLECTRLEGAIVCRCVFPRPAKVRER